MRKKRRVIGTLERPRLQVFRSLKNISVQVIDDMAGKTLMAAGTVGSKTVKDGGNIKAAQAIGREIAEKALSRGINKVVFDRGRFVYHGRVKALADAAREGGLQF